MMGHAPSVENLNAITGNTTLGADDNAPTGSTLVYRKRFIPPESGLFCGDTTTPLWKFNNAIEMEIPVEKHYEPRKPGINYNDEEMPLAMNEFAVSDAELEAFNTAHAESEESFRTLLYNTASVLDSLNDASNYVEAALRDGLDIDIEPDKAVFDAFVHTARLQAICSVTSQLALPKEVRDNYLRKVTELLAEESVKALHKFDEGARQKRGVQAMRDVYHARVKAQEQPEDNSGSMLGIRRSRL